MKNSAQINRRTAFQIMALGALVSAQVVSPAAGQPPVHYRHSTTMPPGQVGQDMLRRGGPLPGYFQPVEIIGPQGSTISLVSEGRFEPAQKESALAGMLIGAVYRFKVSGIPAHEGFEVFPTIEVINRLYPPPGQKARFPIPVHVTAEELQLALNGQFVTRVIYLEDPTAAMPQREDPRFQRHFEVHPDQDPLQVADQLGRPMAILRMGSRIPDGVLNGTFMYGSPPLMKYRKPIRLAPQELKSVVPADKPNLPDPRN